MRTAVISHAGLVRQQNEDNYLILPEHNFFAIADGMGGHQAGACASRLALQVIKEEITAMGIKEDLREELARAVQLANKKIFNLGGSQPDKMGMGTTLTAIWIMNRVGHLAHVGDSRAYLIRDAQLSPLTDDHSLVGELMRHGSLTENEAQSHPQKHMLTRAIGAEEQVKVDTKSMTLQWGDLLLLCTDGLTNLVKDQEINLAFRQGEQLEAILKNLMNLAFQRGGLDNITMLAISLN